MAFRASGPSQRMSSFDPCPAASIIKPMMLLPLKTARNAHKHRRRPRMETQPIHDWNLLLDLLVGRRAIRSSIQQAHYASFCSIKLSSFVLKSTALFWPKSFNF